MIGVRLQDKKANQWIQPTKKIIENARKYIENSRDSISQ